jgi:glycerol-3-phosphate dehydrogenase
LCAQASRYFAKPVLASSVVWRYSGVRPLLDDESGSASAVTRDYLLEFDEAGPGAAPLLTVWGGKITTFRKLAEEAADQLLQRLGQDRPAWTGTALLPGGDLSATIGAPQRPDVDMQRFVQALALRHPGWPVALRERWARLYGARVELLAAQLGGRGLGEEVVHGLYEAELDYLYQHEWARTAHDVLWRRTKLGLHLDAAERERVAHWWLARYPHTAMLDTPAQR